jgi:replication factor C subunit 2/4
MDIRFDEIFDLPCKKDNKVEIIKEKRRIKEIPWVNKYRPKKLSGIIHQKEVILMLKNTLKTGNLPHLLFYGPPGTGKTSTILALARDLFGPKKFSERVIELNASDERGINIVRKKIISFAKMTIGNRDEDYLCPPYKIIILDEADAMTHEAQSALRKTMEDNSSITRFCFICNYINQIITPISSRCSKFRFLPLNNDSLKNKLINISKKEKMNTSEEVIDTIISISNGDMRKAIMTLQNANYYLKYNKKILVEDIYSIGTYIPKKIMKNIWYTIILDEKTLSIKNIVTVCNKLKRLSYPINNILEQLSFLISKEQKLNDLQKSYISYHLLNICKMINDGSNEYLQLINILSFIKGTLLNIEFK